MPWRPMTREQAWLLPPTLDDLLPDDHPARFVAAFVDGLSEAEWASLGVNVDGEALGAPAYHPRALLSVWLYGFMTGVRSSRKLESACRDQVPYLWLTGWQHPDHNTLWRFYQTYRTSMRGLLRQTVRTAVRLDLIDWAVQAVDGTKIAGSASRDRTYDAGGLERLLERAEQAIADLEAQNESGDDPLPPHLPPGLRQARQLRERVLAARQELEEQEQRRTNLTDPDTRLLRGREGAYLVGYNAQAMVAPVGNDDGSHGLLITAAEVTQEPNDTKQLLPLIAAAADATEQIPALTLADTGYFSGANIAACADQKVRVAIPEDQPHTAHPYHKDRFTYDPVSDRFQCPEGQYLSFGHIKRRANQPPVRVYQAKPATCRQCPAFGWCTTLKQGRRIEVMPHDTALQAHRRWMQSAEAQNLFRRRKQIVEPAFGILKDQQAARRFLLRGIDGVRSEWALLATAFNLRTLWQAKRRPLAGTAPL